MSPNQNNHMSVSVSKFVRRQTPTDLLNAFAVTDGIQIINVPVLKGRSFNPATPGIGSEFHDAFHARNQGHRVKVDYFHYIQALRDWLFENGAHRLWTEWEYDCGQRWHGTTDASISAGPKRHGTLEIKVQGADPKDGYVEDWAQIACYCDLAACSGCSIESQWCALAYVLPRQKLIRILLVTDVARLTSRLTLLKTA